MSPYFYTNAFSSFWLAVIMLLGTSCGRQEEHANNSPVEVNLSVNSNRLFSEEVEAIILNKIEVVTQTIARNPLVIDMVKKSNKTNKSITSREIEKLDAEWMKTADSNDYISGFMINECARILLDLQKADHGFSEIFITDSQGLNVAMTNKTSDYYQADEDWWINAFNKGKGRSYYGNIEYDESAMSEAVPLYIPINNDAGAAIGVIKAVADLGVIKKEL